MKKVVVIAALWFLHFASCMVLLVVSVALGMARFETGVTDSYTPPSVTERVVDLVFEVLTFPLVPLFAPIFRGGRFAGPLEYAPLLLNSALWAVCLYLLAAWLWRVSRRPTA